MLNIFFARKPSAADVSIETFFKLCEIVSKSNPKLIALAAMPLAEDLTEALRQIAELLILAEQEENPAYFEMFCERNVMTSIVFLFSADWTTSSVKEQILQTVSLLTTNLNDPTSVYYLFSKNWLNQIIVTGATLVGNDDDLLSHYVNLCKSLSLRLNRETVNFFLDPSAGFPLYTQLTRFFDHPDQMVRASVRTGTLLIFRLLNESRIPGVSPILEDSRGYFTLVACRLRDAWLAISRKRSTEEVTDLLLYVADIFGVENFQLTELLEDKIIAYVIEPTILPGFKFPGPVPLSIFASAQILHFFKKSKCSKLLIEKILEFPEPIEIIAKSADADSGFATLLIHEICDAGCTGSATRTWLIALTESLHLTESIILLKLKLAILKFWGGDISPRRSFVSPVSKKTRAEAAACDALIGISENIIPAFEELLLAEKLPDIPEAISLVSKLVTEPDELVLASSLVAERKEEPLTAVQAVTKWILTRRQVLPEDQDKLVSQVFSRVVTDMTGTAEDSQWAEELSVDITSFERIQCSVKLVDLVGYQQEVTAFFILHNSLMVVAVPDATSVEHATVKIQRRIRSISASIDRELFTTVVVKTEDGRSIRIAFEDAKRSHLALMHLETRKIANRQDLIKHLVKSILEE